MKTVTCLCLTSMKCYILFVSFLISKEHVFFLQRILQMKHCVCCPSQVNQTVNTIKLIRWETLSSPLCRCGVKPKTKKGGKGFVVLTTTVLQGSLSFGVIRIYSSQRYIKVVKGVSVATKAINNVQCSLNDLFLDS